jgi:hypothetical protein
LGEVPRKSSSSLVLLLESRERTLKERRLDLPERRAMGSAEKNRRFRLDLESHLIRAMHALYASAWIDIFHCERPRARNWGEMSKLDVMIRWSLGFRVFRRSIK